MRRLLLFCSALAIVLAGLAQQRATIPKEKWDQAEKRISPILETMNFNHEALPATSPKFTPEEEIIGTTYYDLQSNASMQNRIFVYDDGTVGGVFTLGFDFPTFADDRGTGYNYFDGVDWGPLPTVRIENDRTGWPAYAAWGENGEINCAHYSGAAVEGMVYARRETKGTGNWTFINYTTPVGNELVWPRITTGGVNHDVLHQIAITTPTFLGGPPYQGMDGALLYSRSIDGGDTWEIQDELIEDINSTYYLGFSGDTYEIQSDGDNVAILYGESWQDLGLLKSTDGGDSWSKTLIWEHPYPLWDPNNFILTDTFYCADGAHGLAFDNDGMVHVVFGINRAYSDGTGTFWFPGVDGVGYWNEDRPTFSDDLNALCPYVDCIYTELVDDYSLIGWSQDINGNGELDILDDWGTYYLGFSSMPQIEVDELNNIYLVYSSVTETYDNGTQNYRHLWGRYSGNGDFWGPFVDFTSDLIHIFDECVFPSVASFSDDQFYLVYQTDSEPGLALWGDEDPYGENFIRFMAVDKVGTGIFESQKFVEYIKVSQNHPNPFSEETHVQVELYDVSNMAIVVTSLTGQKVLEMDQGHLQSGTHNITIDAKGLNPGLYFYTVKAGDVAVTRKMVIE